MYESTRRNSNKVVMIPHTAHASSEEADHTAQADLSLPCRSKHFPVSLQVIKITYL